MKLLIRRGDNMTTTEKTFLNNAINKLEQKYGFSNNKASEIIYDSFLYETLLLYPEETMHDDLDETIECIYHDYVSLTTN